MTNPEEAVSKLFDSAASLLHGLVNLAPWRQESDKHAAHEAVEEYIAPLGRNSVAPGVVEQNESETNENKGDANSFPSNPTE